MRCTHIEIKKQGEIRNSETNKEAASKQTASYARTREAQKKELVFLKEKLKVEAARPGNRPDRTETG
jgi:hypothetical protein